MTFGPTFKVFLSEMTEIFWVLSILRMNKLISIDQKAFDVDLEVLILVRCDDYVVFLSTF